MASNIIVMNRGDSFAFSLSIDDETHVEVDSLYRLTDTDVVYLGIMLPHQKFENAIIKKRFTKADQDSSGYIIAEIAPEDTLDLLPGVYYYAVKLRQSTNEPTERISTVINKTKFIIND